MFEHMRNYERAAGRIAGWLEPDGRLFVHVFATASSPTRTTDGWMAREFFTGGIDAVGRPAPPLPARPPRSSSAGASTATHYARTAEAWLERLDADERGR